MKPRDAILYSSILFFVILLGVAAKATHEPWKAHQQEYNQIVRKMEAASGQGGPGSDLTVEVRQDVIKGLAMKTTVDRCRSCHVAIDDERFKEHPHPLKAHPEVPGDHSFGKFGCTVCHEGNGRALAKYYAHGEDHFWPEPILKKPYIEASCAKCHTAPYLPETPHLKRGKELFVRYACISCHTVKGLSRGTQGPELTEVGSHFKLDYLEESITNPHANTQVTSMPKFKMNAQDRADLVTYLKSLRGRPLTEAPLPLQVKLERWKDQKPEETEATVEAGRLAFERHSCLACHKVDGEDGQIAPDLSFVGNLRDEEFIVEHLKNPRAHTPGSIMPSFWLSDSEAHAIAKYLLTLKAKAVPETPALQYTALCARCHGAEGKGDGPIAVNLVPRPRQFTNGKFFNWLPEERAHKAIRNGVPGTAMPPFDKMLSEEQIEELFQYVRTHFLKVKRFDPVKPRKLPEKNPVPADAASIERGRKEFQGRCYGCHGRLANGNGPNALDMLPRPRDLTSEMFFQDLDEIRLYESITYGIVGTGMPPWDYLPEKTRWDLVNYVRSISHTGPTSAAAQNPGGTK